MGVAATLAWQSYSDSHPQLGWWLAAETVGAGTTSEPTLPVAPTATSDVQEKTVAADTTPGTILPIAPATTSDPQEKTVAAETASETILPIAPASTSDPQEKTIAAETTPETTTPIAPATKADSQEINKAILMSLAAVRQSVERLAAKQQQMSNDIATLKAAEQNILRKINSAPSARPAAAPARKPASRSPQEPPRTDGPPISETPRLYRPAF
jgi:hypothetical protein